MSTKQAVRKTELRLTKAQRLAVTGSGKNILVSAGAGTGKTRVLVERFLHFVLNNEALVTEILAITFTEKAANEMKSRIMKRFAALGRDQDRRDLESAYISTIHAFCARVLKEHPLEAGVDPDFRVIEPEESDYLKDQALDDALDELCVLGSDIFELVRTYEEEKLREGLRAVLDSARNDGKPLAEYFKSEVSFDVPESPAALLRGMGEDDLATQFEQFERLPEWGWDAVREYKNWQKTFSRKGKGDWKEIKRRCQGFLAVRIEELISAWKQRFETLAVRFEEIYDSKKKKRGFLDFDDLQMKAVQLFKKDTAVHRKLRKQYQEKFRHLLIDEFQDTNSLQMELIQLLKNGENLFFVGDFKQSIYRFRGAEPAHFLKIEETYGVQQNGVRIPLLENFRASRQVLAFINDFFENLWKEDDFPFEPLLAEKEEAKDSGIELLVVRAGEEETMDHARMREAAGIAERIGQLHEEGMPFGHIAVLFQAVKDIGIYEQALKRRDIPYFTLSGRSFYYQPEIRDMMSFLSFLENPLSDIPLAAVLRSPMFQISNDALFWLAHEVKSGDRGRKSTPLYEGVKRFEENAHLSEQDRQKLRFFRDVAAALFRLKDELKLTELIDRILSKTSYELNVLADSQGVRRYANLKKLMNVAREFEQIEPLRPGDFLRIIRRLQVQEARESEAQIEAESSGQVVRLLSIHRAKGLEFPVVFVADLGHARHNSQSKRILAEPGMGYSLQAFHAEEGEWVEPASWQAINESAKRKEKEEWKRLFYVASTRAEKRLIFSGVYKEKKKEKETFSEMSSWMDWMMGSPEQLREIIIHETPTHFPVRRKYAAAEKKEFRTLFKDFEPVAWEKLIPERSLREQTQAEAQKILSSLGGVKNLPSRVIDAPVSAYAVFCRSPERFRRTYEIGYPDTEAPSKPGENHEEQEVSARDFGTAFHWILERLDFANPVPGMDPLVQYAMRGLGKQAVSRARDLLSRFVKTPLFAEIRSAKTVKRELSFLLNERHGLIHGVIDILFETADGRWCVADYKTGKGDLSKIEAMGYDKQMEIYAHAVSALLDKIPAEIILYFMDNGWEHRQPVDKKWLEAAEGRLKQDQEKMLEMRNQMILNEGQ